MNIEFGMYLDGAEWSQSEATLGTIAVGPLGLLERLEDRLGLSGVAVSTPERINEYMQKVTLADCAWCKASFELDSWSTAKQLLGWRDELIEAGWDGADGGSERLKTLWQIEQTNFSLSPGIGDRLQLVLKTLDDCNFQDTLTLAEPLDLLPPVWRKVMQKLEMAGMTLIQAVSQDYPKPEIHIVTSTDEFTNATQLVRYLASGDNRDLALICENDSRILDGVLHRHGLGALGIAEASRWRESLQILPLLLETMWKPFHPQRFLELLLLPQSPIPKMIGRELIKALQEEPGIGGEMWNEAWKKATENIHENKDDWYKDIEHEIGKLASLRELLEGKGFNVYEGIPEETIQQRCDWLIKLLSWQVEEHSGLALAVSHAKTLKTITQRKGQINRVDLARMLDSMISTGTIGNANQGEVNDFYVATHPGALQQDFGTVLWWNFIDHGKAKNTYWTQQELAVLPGIDSTALRKRETLAWHNALIHAKKRLIVFVPTLLAGEPVFPHPLLDELDPAGDTLPRLSAEDMTDNYGLWQLAERKTQLQALHKDVAIPTGKEIEPEELKPLRGLSYSQITTFLSCPFQWFLQDYLGLKLPPAIKMNIKAKTTMIGSLAHKVVECLFKESKEWNPDEAKSRAGVLFEELTPQMAAELLLDGRSEERRRLRTVLLEAIESLVKEINGRRLTIVGTELKKAGIFDGNEFSGKIDILLEDASGKPFVIDMKWSSAKLHKRNLEKGRALQLATYSWLLDPDSFDVQCAYFIISQQKFIIDENQDWGNLWRNAKETWIKRLAKIRGGDLERGIYYKGKDEDGRELEKLLDLPSSLPLTLGAVCKFCNFSALCGREGELTHE